MQDESLLRETYQAGLRRFPDSPVPRVEPMAAALRELALRDLAAAQLTAEQFVVAGPMAEAWSALPPR